MFKLLKINSNIRSFRRYLHIVRVFSRYGFDQALESFGLADMAQRSRRMLRQGAPDIARLSTPERLRLALEELGPTFIKLGQILSTRPDVVPMAFVLEFEKLQNNVPSFPFEEVRSQLTRELGGPCDSFFSEIDPEPLAAASIAQVHCGRLNSGERVAIKVRRPGIVEVVESDISALMMLANLAELHVSGSELYDPVGLVQEFARSIRREMDFLREGHTIEKFRDNFSGNPWMHFPQVFWEQSARGVLTMEFIEGIKVSDLAKLDLQGYDRKTIANRGADLFLEMVLNHGFFHGDPHPGNVLILPGNTICLLDYGIVGRLDDNLKFFLIDLLHAIVSRDMEAIVSLLLLAGDITGEPDIRKLKRDLFYFIDSYYEIPLKDIKVGQMLMEFIEVITLHNIHIQPELMLLIKSLVLIEGMGRNLDPDFNMVEQLRPVIIKTLRQKYSPKRISSDINATLLSYLNLARTIPRDLKEIINRVNRNKFKIDLEHRGLDKFTADFDRSINRLSISMILAAMIIGSSIIMQTDKGPKLMGFPVLAFMGYCVAGMVGLWLIYAVIRSGRM